MKVLPVVVLYNLSLSECESVNSLQLQNIKLLNVDKLFVYDNSPDASLNSWINGEFNGLEVIYFHDINNSGVSKAYNDAADYAQKNGYDWLLLLDQDTVLPVGAFDKYHQAVSNNPNIPVFSPILKTKNNVICSPCRFKFHRGFTPDHVPLGLVHFRDYAPINSCMLVSTEKLLSVGGYNEGAYLDFSDFQFIERLKKKYLEFFVVDFIALQDFSNDTKDISALKKRFEIYCKCARACEKDNVLDLFQYFLIVFFRMGKLTLRTRSFGFIKTFIFNYVFK